jgi:hypothetical protein
MQSRHIYGGPEEKSVSELFDATVNCEFLDTDFVDNRFEIELRSDAFRKVESVRYDEKEEVHTDELGSEITITRTSATVLTRTSGTWIADALIDFRVWAYTSGAEESGAWVAVSSNTTTALTLVSDAPTGCNRLKIQATPKIRHNIQIVTQPGFYGSFISYKIRKKIQNGGTFKFFNFEANGVPTSIDQEFLAAMGTVSNPTFENT